MTKMLQVAASARMLRLLVLACGLWCSSAQSGATVDVGAASSNLSLTSFRTVCVRPYTGLDVCGTDNAIDFTGYEPEVGYWVACAMHPMTAGCMNVCIMCAAAQLACPACQLLACSGNSLRMPCVSQTKHPLPGPAACMHGHPGVQTRGEHPLQRRQGRMGTWPVGLPLYQCCYP